MYYFLPMWYLTADPEDYSSAMHYNMTFRQTAFTDRGGPTDTVLSSSILIDITNDDIFEGMEYIQARIVETSDRFRVRIGQDTVNITITDSELYMFDVHVNSYISATILYESMCNCTRIYIVNKHKNTQKQSDS